MTKYDFHNRRIIDENSRFFICFDTLTCNNGYHLDNYLTIKPKICHENDVVGVCILPRIGTDFALMKGWRHQLNTEIWQAPAGFVEPEESTIESAQRELLEETGLFCPLDDIVPLGSILPDAGLIQGRIALYLANSCSLSDSSTLQTEIGTGNLFYFSQETILNMTYNSSNIGGSTAVAIYRSLYFLNVLNSTQKFDNFT